ncbi:MAG: endo-1,4-beta-xylanase [Planctomycetota bacterium]
MLRFTVHGSDDLVARTVESAWLFGPEEVPVPAEISVESGSNGVSVIRCEKHSAEPAGISLVPSPTDLPGVSSAVPLVLQTCLLQERERPYSMTLELARHRIMTFLNKLEDWSLFDLETAHPAMEAFERARQAFTSALVALGGDAQERHAETDTLAKEALTLSVLAGERLVEAELESRFPARVRGETYQRAYRALPARPSGPPPLLKNPTGTGIVLPSKPFAAATVAASRFSDSEAQLVRGSSDFLSLPMRWTELEPDEGKYNFAPTDRWIEWAVRTAKMPVVAGPVVDFSAKGAPEWLHIWEHDYETLREVVYEHVRSVVTRYRRTVPRWTIASGLHRNDNFALTFEQMMDLTRMVVLLTRKLQPSAKVQVEVVQPFSGDAGRSPRSLPGVIYADMAAQSGVAVDAYAVRLELAAPNPGSITRDLMTLSATVDRFAVLERPIVANIVTATRFDRPGRAWLARAMEIVAAKPWVYAVTCESLTPDARRLPAGLSATDGAPLDSIATLSGLREGVRNTHRVDTA